MNKLNKELKAAIVLSGGITCKGTLPYFVKYRLDEAYKQYHADHVKKIIVCGKWSYHLEENPPRTEAEAMSTYLQTLGVPKKDIIQEDKSVDLISCVLYLKKELLIQNKFTHVMIVGSDFQEERLEYIWKFIFGSPKSYTIKLVPSMLPPELLWKFFLYDRETLIKTKVFLRGRKLNLDIFSNGKYKKSALYKNTVSDYLPQLVYSNNLGRSSSAKAHYSLVSIYKKRIEIFHKYNLDLKRKRTLKADFWSGRFLNFLGRDPDRSYYCLKFALKHKDKQTFINEVTITKLLKEKDINYIPTIVDQHIQKAPLWYLYKVVGGRMSGEFSRTFCFDDYFYQSYVPKELVSHIKSLQSILLESRNLPVMDGKQYSIKIDKIYKKFQTRKLNKKDLNRIINAGEIVKGSSKLLNSSILYLSHGDLHPANIIISTSRKRTYIIDFEHIGLNNIAFDFSFIYLFSWNNPSFQKKFLRQYLSVLTPKQKEEFTAIFPYVYTYFLLWLLDYTYTWKYRTEAIYVNSAKTYIEKELDKIIEMDKNNQLYSYIKEGSE